MPSACHFPQSPSNSDTTKNTPPLGSQDVAKADTLIKNAKAASRGQEWTRNVYLNETSSQAYGQLSKVTKDRWRNRHPKKSCDETTYATAYFAMTGHVQNAKCYVVLWQKCSPFPPSTTDGPFSLFCRAGNRRLQRCTSKTAALHK